MEVFDSLQKALKPDMILQKIISDNKKEIPNLKSISLQQVAEEIEEAQWAAEIYDKNWCLQWCSSELKNLINNGENDNLGYGKHIIEVMQKPAWRNLSSLSSNQTALQNHLAFIAYDTPGQNKTIKKIVDSLNLNLKIENPVLPSAIWTSSLEFEHNNLPPISIICWHVRLVDENGFQGTVRIYGPNLKASILSLVMRGNINMFERMASLVEPGPRRAAIMFVDMQARTQISRMLSSSAYFQLLSAFAKGIDDAIIEQEGIVGKHVGDGATGFFISESIDDISFTAMKALKASLAIEKLAVKLSKQLSKELQTNIEIKANVGLHWGSNIYMGQIVTGGRLEVTSFGDKVNECARIESCAQNGAILASKDLIERLDGKQTKTIGFDVEHVIYEDLQDNPFSNHKVERDVPTLAVADISKLVRKNHHGKKK